MGLKDETPLIERLRRVHRGLLGSLSFDYAAGGRAD